MPGPTENQDFNLWIGRDQEILIPVFKGDGTAINLAGASSRWWLARRNSTTETAVWIKKYTGGGGITWSQASAVNQSGQTVADVWHLNVDISAEDTIGIPPGHWYHEAVVWDGDGNVVNVIVGTATAKRTLIPHTPVPTP